MDKITCIILNYNDAKTTLHLAGELKESKVLSDMVIVDNCSTDDSWEMLCTLKENGESGPKIHLLRTKKNGGYGAGNQAGIDFAVEKTNPDYIVIANPDIHVTDQCLLRVKEALDAQKDGALASAMVKSPEGKPLFSYWNLLPFWGDLFDTGLFTRRLLKPFLLTPLLKLPMASDKNSRLAGAVPGSFFMLKMSCFSEGEGGALFDPEIFLYYEEKILAQKLKARGLTEVLVTDASYVHAHSVSIDKSIAGLTAKQKILHESKLYYYKEYLHAGKGKMMAAKLFLAVVLAEVKVLSWVLRHRRR